MVYLIGIPLMVMLSILQSAIFNDFLLLKGRPDIILLILICLALHEHSRSAIILGFFAGLFLDSLSGLPVGLTSISLVGIMFLVSFTEGKFWETRMVLLLGVTLAASLIYYLGNLLILITIGHNLSVYDSLLRIILPSTFLNLIFAIPVWMLTRSIFHLNPEELEFE